MTKINSFDDLKKKNFLLNQLQILLKVGSYLEIKLTAHRSRNKKSTQKLYFKYWLLAFTSGIYTNTTNSNHESDLLRIVIYLE